MDLSFFNPRNWRQGKNFIGLDIGSRCVKVAELIERKNGFYLKNFGIKELPPETIVDGAIMNASAMVDTIAQLWDELRLKNRNVAIGFGGNAVITKKIELPEMTREELNDSIKMETADRIPFDINEVNSAYHVLSSDSRAPDHMNVMIMAAKKEFVNEYVSIVSEAGLNACVADLGAFAVQNIYERVFGFESLCNLIFVNTGLLVTNVNIVSPNGDSLFVRDFANAGDNITKEIQKNLNVTYEEAEALKIGGDNSSDESSVVPAEMTKIVQTSMSAIVDVVGLCVDGYDSTGDSFNDKNTKIVLTGGTSQLTGFDLFLGAKLGFPVEKLNPFQGMDYDSRKFNDDYLREAAPLASVAMGLALRRDGDEEE